MSAAKRRSRMTRTPIGKRIELTSRDMAIFTHLQNYRYLPSTYLHAFVGGASEKRFKERLGTLFHEGYIDRPDEQWRFANCRHVPAVYELGNGGRRVLESHGATEPQARTALRHGAQRQFFHTLMICEILASIELAVRQHPHLRFIPWAEIFARAPKQTRDSAHPLRIPVPGAQTAGTLERASSIARGLVPDALFGLEYRAGDKKSYRFFALEADRDTMPVVRSNRFQTSYQDKMQSYQNIIAHLNLTVKPKLNRTAAKDEGQTPLDSRRSTHQRN